MKKLSYLILWLFCGLSFKALSSLAGELELILNCPAVKSSAHMKVLRDIRENYFLLIKIDENESLLQLETMDGDMGYTTYTIKNSKSKQNYKDWVSYVHVKNNEDEVSSTSDAVITGGEIVVEDSDIYQECKLVGKAPKLFPKDS